MGKDGPTGPTHPCALKTGGPIYTARVTSGCPRKSEAAVLRVWGRKGARGGKKWERARDRPSYSLCPRLEGEREDVSTVLQMPRGALSWAEFSPCPSLQPFDLGLSRNGPPSVLIRTQRPM